MDQLAGSYRLPSGDYGRIFKDRIELVNSKAERNADRRETVRP